MKLIVEKVEGFKAKLISITKGSISKNKGTVIKEKDYTTSMPTDEDKKNT